MGESYSFFGVTPYDTTYKCDMRDRQWALASHIYYNTILYKPDTNRI